MIYHQLSVLAHRQAEKYGDRVALKYRDYDKEQWIPVTWNQLSETVHIASNAMVEMGVTEQENSYIEITLIYPLSLIHIKHMNKNSTFPKTSVSLCLCGIFFYFLHCWMFF